MWYNKGSSSTKMFIGQSASGDATWFGTKHSTEVRVLSARLKIIMEVLSIGELICLENSRLPDEGVLQVQFLPLPL